MKGYLAASDDIDVPVIEEQILRFGPKHPCCTKFDEESFLAKTDLVPERYHNCNAENDTINKVHSLIVGNVSARKKQITDKKAGKVRK